MLVQTTWQISVLAFGLCLCFPVIKNPPANAGDVEMQIRSRGQEDPLEEDTATHSSTLAWRIPWTEEPGGL